MTPHKRRKQAKRAERLRRARHIENVTHGKRPSDITTLTALSSKKIRRKTGLITGIKSEPIL